MKNKKNNCEVCGQPCCDKCGTNPCHHEKSASQNDIVNSKGELLFTITRSSFNITQDLPYFIWGVMYVNNLDGSALTPFLGAGTTVVVSKNTNGDLIFTFTNGILVDTVTISTTAQGLISYIEAVQSLQTYYMRSNYMLWAVNVATNAGFLTNPQINTLLTTGIIMRNIDASTNVGGGKKQHLIIPRSRTIPANSMINLVEIYLRREEIKTTTIWINKFAFIPGGEALVNIQNAATVFYSEVINMNEEAEKVLACLQS